MREPVFLGSNKHLLIGSQRKPSDLRLLDVGMVCNDGTQISEFALNFTEQDQNSLKIVFMHLNESQLLIAFEPNTRDGPYRLEVWDVEERNKLFTKFFEMPRRTMNQEKAINEASFAIVNMINGPCLAVSLVRELGLYDITTLNQMAVLDQGSYTYIKRIVASSCGKILVCEEDRKVSFWDIENQQKVFSQNMAFPIVHSVTSEMAYIVSFTTKLCRSEFLKGKHMHEFKNEEYDQMIINFIDTQNI